MMKKKLFAVLAAVSVLAMLGTGCGKDTNGTIPDPDTNNPGTTEPDTNENGNGTGNGSANAEGVEGIWAAIKEKIGEEALGARMDFNTEDIKELYGVEAGDMKHFIGSVPMMNVSAQEFLIIEAEEGRVDAIEEGMKARQAELERQWADYLPDQYELVKDARIVKSGNHILFVVSEHADDAEAIFLEKTKTP